MKKFLLFFILFTLVTAFLVPQLAIAVDPLVPCGNSGQPCKLSDFSQLLVNIFDFMVLYIATPLATLVILIGGILMLVSAGDPGLAKRGKDMIMWAIIAIVLIWGSYLIIDTILKAIGYNKAGSWPKLPF